MVLVVSSPVNTTVVTVVSAHTLSVTELVKDVVDAHTYDTWLTVWVVVLSRLVVVLRVSGVSAGTVVDCAGSKDVDVEVMNTVAEMVVGTVVTSVVSPVSVDRSVEVDVVGVVKRTVLVLDAVVRYTVDVLDAYTVVEYTVEVTRFV
jgi:hypothetical protein